MLIACESMEAGRDTPLEGKLGAPPGALRRGMVGKSEVAADCLLVALSVLRVFGTQETRCQRDTKMDAKYSVNLQAFSTPCRKPVRLATHNFDFTPKSHPFSPLDSLSFGCFSLYRFALAVFVR